MFPDVPALGEASGDGLSSLQLLLAGLGCVDLLLFQLAGVLGQFGAELTLVGEGLHLVLVLGLLLREPGRPTLRGLRGVLVASLGGFVGVLVVGLGGVGADLDL